MATLETQIVDDIIVKSRRKMFTMGATALAGLAFAGTQSAQAQTVAYTDADILNFALNLEYLEANFYYLAAFGTTIDKSNALSLAAGAPVITLNGTVGTPGTVTAKTGAKNTFTTATVASYAIETAAEEGKHVAFLQSQLSTAAVAQPAIDLLNSFNTLFAAASGISGATFDPFANDMAFLIGAYIFEDVGVTAYHGAAPLLTGTMTTLPAAAAILAVEAYHAGLIRTTLNYLDPSGTVNLPGTSLSLQAITQAISKLRATLSLQANSQAPNPDDFGIQNNFMVGIGGGIATRLTDADPTNVIAFSRNTTQVLNIVTGGGAINGSAVVSPAKGVFFPNGINAGPNGFK